MKKILFLCKENSARSQMAEGIVNYFYKDEFVAYSAGSNPKYVHPLAIKVMEEIGIDISKNRSKSVEEFINLDFDYVITVCAGDRKGVCPVFPGKAKKILYWEIPDPAESNNIEEFRKTRDLLRKKVEIFVKSEISKEE